METVSANLYSILGVKPNASKSAIKMAFRSLAKKYHPDMNKGDRNSEKKFKEIKYAYEILCDDKKRCEYDKLNGYDKVNTTNKQTYSNPYKASENYKKQQFEHKKQNTQKTKQEENNFKEEFSKFINEFFSAKEKTETPINGTDINVEITISIMEAQNGTTRQVNILHSECCPNCHGKKFINGLKCPQCNSLGYLSYYKTLSVKIPMGTVNGKIIVIKDEGNRGEFGGKNGNLILKVNIEKSNVFRFNGLNVLSDIPISPTEAALGTTIQIKTINGLINMKIPAETSSGQKFRLHEQGIFDKEKNIKGDHIVTVFIKMPKNLSLKEKELYNKLAKIRDFNPREN